MDHHLDSGDGGFDLRWWEPVVHDVGPVPLRHLDRNLFDPDGTHPAWVSVGFIQPSDGRAAS